MGKTPDPLPEVLEPGHQAQRQASAAPLALGRPLQPLQRFRCNACRTTFTHERSKARRGARFADDVVEEAVRTYVQGLSSYRVLATMLEHRLGQSVSRVALNSWVQELGPEAKTPLEVSAELTPRWGGFLGVDGKAIYVRGAKHCLLIGVDHPTQDLVHAAGGGVRDRRLLCPPGYEARLDAGYPLKRSGRRSRGQASPRHITTILGRCRPSEKARDRRAASCFRRSWRTRSSH